jgi:hypothetical protein
MVQTPLGAKSNPWIAYMKECRLNYNAVQNEGKRLTVTLDAPPEGEIKKKILKPTPKGSKDRVDAAAAAAADDVDNVDRDNGSSTKTTKTTKTRKTTAPTTLATFLP